MHPLWCLIAFSCHLVRQFGPTISCCHFWRTHFIVLRGQKYQHDDCLGPCASIHLICTLFSPTFDMRWLIYGKYRGVAAKVGDFFICIWMFRGSRRQISPGCWFEIPILILNNNQPQLLNGKGIKHRPLVYLSNLYANERSFVPVWKVMEANRCENSTILSRISAVVDLHEESGPITQQTITNAMTLSYSRLRVCI